ncbi:rCG63718 [Rattus norvegicus]|uniref:RCG63718 n=1 Tax=Rattus norvegicus TaxID=10116 RepID=A6I849_RAT|nr:rCG63718 [Rattus norvegicus]
MFRKMERSLNAGLGIPSPATLHSWFSRCCFCGFTSLCVHPIQDLLVFMTTNKGKEEKRPRPRVCDASVQARPSTLQVLLSRTTYMMLLLILASALICHTTSLTSMSLSLLSCWSNNSYEGSAQDGLLLKARPLFI